MKRDTIAGPRATGAHAGGPPPAIAVVAEFKVPLAALLNRLGPDARDALADGRIFVGAKRALTPEHLVESGQEVVMFRARRAEGEVVILGERDGIVAVAKPAALASVPDRQGRTGSLVQALVERVGAAAQRWEPTSRLDVGVSGVVLFAADGRARQWLAKARAEHRYLRHYVAIAERAPDPPRGLWNASIGRARDPCLRRVGGRDAQEATTRYAVAAEAPRTGAALLAVEPETGRTHQIRVHAAHVGAKLIGDAAYGGMTRLVEPTGAVRSLRRIALHAAWVEVPPRPDALVWRVEAPLENDLKDLWLALSGEPDAWFRALERCGQETPSSDGRPSLPQSDSS